MEPVLVEGVQVLNSSLLELGWFCTLLTLNIRHIFHSALHSPPVRYFPHSFLHFLNQSSTGVKGVPLLLSSQTATKMATPVAAATPMDAVSKVLVLFLDGRDGEEGFCETMRQRMMKGDGAKIDKKKLLIFFAKEVLQARKLTQQQALAFRDTFVRPVTTNILKIDQESAGCMARLVVW